MSGLRGHQDYSHGLLVHDNDDELVEASRDFVEQGLSSGGQVLVHSTEPQVELLRDLLGTHPRLEYALDKELYQAPMRTLFAYQQKLADSVGTQFWVTGTVPLGRGDAEQAAWARYESVVNEALGAFPFRALCTYDTRKVPASVVAAARATHPCSGREYVDPSAFLLHPLAAVPQPPSQGPSWRAVLDDLDDLPGMRRGVKAAARRYSAALQQSIDEFVVAVNEVAANGLVHGAPPVHVTLWADITTLTGHVVDSGAGSLGSLTGFRYPAESEPMGLWATRQLVDDMFISNAPGGGCQVLLIKD